MFFSRLKSRVHLTTTTDSPDAEQEEPHSEEEQRTDEATSNVEHQL